MYRLKKAIFLLPMLAALTLLVSSASAQEVVYADGNDGIKPIKNGEIVTDKKFITISWSVIDDLQPPFIVRRIHRNSVVEELQTDVATVFLDVSTFTPSEVIVTSAYGQTFSVNLRYDYSRAFTIITLAIAIIGVIVILVWIVFRHMQTKSEAIVHANLATVNHKVTKRFECSTILFADIQGFTKIAEHTDPEQLVDELDRYFIYFDELVETYNVEKIKTIGDAYMCAGGVPVINSANPIEVTLVGLAMISYVRERQKESSGFWNIRVGINTGPVVSGMLGSMKRVFDIWGDSVNTASRMESSGVSGEVNISGNTYRMIADYFECEYRGKMPVKYKGDVDMYFVRRLKPEYAQGGSEIKPNALLQSRIRLMKVMDLETTLLQSLIIPTSDNVRKRFEAFMFQLEFLAKGEGLKDDSYAICKAAAILSFAYLEFPKDSKIVFGNTTQMFTKMQFSEDQIEEIGQTLSHIMQSRLPETLIEEVIYDARYHFYGRKDMLRFILDWSKEMRERGRKVSKKDWLKEHKHFLTGFTFYSETAQRIAVKNTAEQLRVLSQIIREC